MRLRSLLALSLIGAALAGCASNDDEVDTSERSVEVIYNEAADAMEANDLKAAVDLFNEVERQHPYSRWAARALLMSGYASYLNNDYIAAEGSLDRFISLHPGDDDIAYAYYLRGLTQYEQITDVQRDHSYTENAQEAFEEVIRRFPDSPYARDARLKLDLTEDNLAGKHMEIGRYYLRQRQELAAINRFRTVIEDYQTTTHVPEALHRLTEAYLTLGIPEEAQMSAAVLGHNFPGSEWYEDSYALLEDANLAPERSSGSWLSRRF